MLRATRLHLIGVCNLVVEVYASRIKGMLSNPNAKPNAAINRRTAGLLPSSFLTSS